MLFPEEALAEALAGLGPGNTYHLYYLYYV